MVSNEHIDAARRHLNLYMNIRLGPQFYKHRSLSIKKRDRTDTHAITIIFEPANPESKEIIEKTMRECVEHRASDWVLRYSNMMWPTRTNQIWVQYQLSSACPTDIQPTPPQDDPMAAFRDAQMRRLQSCGVEIIPYEYETDSSDDTDEIGVDDIEMI